MYVILEKTTEINEYYRGQGDWATNNHKGKQTTIEWMKAGIYGPHESSDIRVHSFNISFPINIIQNHKDEEWNESVVCFGDYK